MFQRLIPLGKAAFYGCLLVSMTAILAVCVIAAVSIAAGIGSFRLGLGPVPFMQAWNDSTSWGFRSDWGLVLFSIAGAVAGLALGLRRQAMAETSPSGS